MMCLKKTLPVIILLYLFSSKGYGQCEAILPVTDSAMQYIDDPYQLTFLHKVPVNRLDSLMERLLNTPMIIDSNYFDWNYTQPRIRPVHDFEKLHKIVDSIGQLKTDEALCILCLPFMLTLKVYDDLKPINRLTGIFGMHGAAAAINKYYLDNQVSTQLAFPEFQNEVYSKTIEIRGTRFRHLTYCKPLTGDALLLYTMQQVNPGGYDHKIKEIIEKYLSHQHSGHSYEPDSIMIEILQLPFVTDAEWDTGLEKNLNKPPMTATKDKQTGYNFTNDSVHSVNQLGVIINDNEKGYSMERIYRVLITHSGFAYYSGAEYGIRFIENVRQQLEKEEEQKLNTPKK